MTDQVHAGIMPDAPADDNAYLDALAAQLPGARITTVSGNGQHAPAIDNPRLSAALAYAARGWKALPLHTPIFRDGLVFCTCKDGARCDSIGKHPRYDKDLLPHGVHSASDDPDLIRKWWAKWPDANVGLATGKVSGRDVLDIDPKHGGDVSLAELIRQYDGLPETPIQITGSGGNHLTFAYSGRIGNKVGFAPGLDTRSDSGLIVAEPSIHASGREYTWEVTAHPDDMPLATMPEWLINLITTAQVKSQGIAQQPTGDNRIADGQRNSTLTSDAGAMRRRGMTPEAIEAGLLAENQERCNPPLPENEVKQIARSVAKYPPKEGRKRTPTDDELAQRWLDDHPRTAYGLGDWRRYAVGVWPVVPDDVIKREVREIMIAAKPEGVRPSLYALSSVAGLARLTVSIPDEQWDADHDILACCNGALKISTRELLPHDPAYHVTEALPFDYDPNADAPTLRYVLDSTIPEAANFVQEFAGYCLTPDTSLETALWFHGIPGGGRSTVIGGFEAMLGKRAGVLGLAAVERSQFALTNLPGKTLVTSTEQPNLYIRSSHILNAIISGEPLIVEKKFESPYQITPRAKILWALNDLPRISEANSGLFRRVKVVSFPPRDETQRDPTIKERVKQEGAGILNWALDGLERLRQRGYFEIPPCVQAATAEFKATNDIPQMFVDEMCLTGPDYKAQGSTLYTAYRNWCIDTGHKPQSSTSVADDWKRLGFGRYRAAGKTFWRGIGLASGEATG